MCLWWRGTDSGCSGCWQEDWCCGLDNISPVRGCYRLQRSCLYSLGHYRWLCARWHACFIYRQRWHKCGTCFALQCSDMFPLLVIDQRAACVNNGTGVTALCAPYTGMHTLCSIRRLQRACSSFKNIPPCFFSSAHPTRAQSSLAQQSLQSPSQFDYICD